MTITPDTKDWTWVLTRPCQECGFDASALARQDIGPRLRQAAADMVEALGRGDAHTRPRPEVWSPLEYACHVRDVTEVFLRRLRLMLTTEDPLFENWDQDRTAVERDYPRQDPQVVAGELREGAELLASAFDTVPDGSWERSGRRSDGAVFTVVTLGRYLVHDPVHHVWDVTGARQH